MPVNQIADPASEETEGATSAKVIVTFVNGDTVALKLGQVVEVITYNGTGQMKVKRGVKTGDFKLVGVVVGGRAPGTTVPVGTIAQVCTEGLCQVLAKGTIIAGDLAIISTATTGVAKNSATVTAGKTLGWFQHSVTLAAAALTWMYVHKV